MQIRGLKPSADGFLGMFVALFVGGIALLQPALTSTGTEKIALGSLAALLIIVGGICGTYLSFRRPGSPSLEPLPQISTIEMARNQIGQKVAEAHKYMTHPCFPEFLRGSPDGLEKVRLELRETEKAARPELLQSGNPRDAEIDKYAIDLMRAMRPLALTCRNALDPPLWYRIRRTWPRPLDAGNLPEPIRSERAECIPLSCQLLTWIYPNINTFDRCVEDAMPPKWPLR